jgi:hypothetical protein
MFLDNSACNLASFNLMKFVNAAGVFEIEAYRHGISIIITAMEILVDNSGYPTEAISRNSHDYRPLGLGYANLGALLMIWRHPSPQSCADRHICSPQSSRPTVRRWLRPLRLPHQLSGRVEPARASTSTASLFSMS